MTFTARIEASELSAALDRLKPAKSVVVELRPTDDGLTFVTSGLNLSIDTTAVAGAEGGVVRLPLRPLASWAGFADGAVKMTELDDGRIELTTRRSNLRLAPVLAADGMNHVWSSEPAGEAIEWSPNVWDAFGRCLPAAATDEAKPQFCSVNIEAGCVWSTDTYRMHLVELPELEPLGFLPLPSSALESVKVLDKANVTASRDDAGKNLLHLTDGRTHVAIVLLANEAPFAKNGKTGRQMYDQLSHAERFTVTTSRKALDEAINAAASMTGDPRITLSMNDATLTIAAGSEGQDATFDIDAEGEDWGDRRIGVEKSRFDQFVGATSSDQVILLVTDNVRPVRVIEPGGFMGLLMTVRADTDGSW